MKKIAVIGATGYVGSAVVAELASRGHQVTAFARNTDKVAKAGNIQAVSFDVNSADFAEQLKGFDAVVSAFKADYTSPSFRQDYLTGANAVVEAAKVAQVPYLLIVGGAGSLFVAPNVQLVDTPAFPQEIYLLADTVRVLANELVNRRDVNWAFISPPALLGATGGYSEDRTGEYRLGNEELLMNGEAPAGISVADLAIAIADDAEQQAHLFKRFTVASK
ncbi:NAD(P)-dependent oxidoreductase [Exercitatus varius]|uniref:NAD(P)-dependent oxidoreductase n=1 Tax=Exercitatus varius TaxID=67857 RepID=UPI00294A9EF1|nr:NAD(P)H-binding protein [Exercitatus varius]MDG2941298.1 NAD(P)H-binding protein [Exercitatus varius]